MKNRSVFSVRNSLLTIAGVLSLAVISFSSMAALQALDERSIQTQVLRANGVADLLLNSANNWAVERGVTNAALAGKAAISSAARATIDARRSAADASFAKAVARIKANPVGGNLLPDVEAAFTTAKQLRRVADQQLGQAKSRRTPNQYKAWVPSMTNLIMKSQAMRSDITGQVNMDATSSQLTSLKNFAWQMSEFAGRERAVMGATISGNTRLDANRLRTLSSFRGQVESAWSNVTGLARGINIPKAVTDAVANAQSGYFNTFENTRRTVYTAGTESAAYPIKATEWIAAATQGINSLLAIRSAVSKSWAASGNAPEANQISDQLIIAAGNWAVERGVTNSALNAEVAIANGARNTIDQRRRQADMAYDQAMKMIATGPDFAGKSKLIAELQAAHTAANALRTTADAALQKLKAARDPAVVKNWLPTMTARILKSQALRFAATRAAAQTDPKLADYLAIKHAAWTMAEFAGRERAVMGGIISAQIPLSAQRRTSLSTFRGRVVNSWETVNQLIDESSAAGLRKAVADAKTAYFDTFENVRTNVYNAGLRSAAYPVAAQEWIQRSTAAIDSLLNVQKAATQATMTHVDHSLSAATTIFVIDLILVLITLIIAVAAIWIVMARITGPMDKMTSAMARLADNDLDTEVPATNRTDEIGEMAAAVLVFKENGLERERLQAEQEAEQKARQERAEKIEQRTHAFDQTVTGALSAVGSATDQMQSSAETMSSTADETGHRSTAVAAAAEQASANVQTVASAAEELSSSISEISRQVTTSTEIAAQAASQAEETNQTVQGLAEAAQKIGEIVALITDIAEQTNLLALNATIEAARAGDAGKGFAVVASEVKNLATQTAKATEEIGLQIRDIQTATDDSVEAIGSFSVTIGRINEISSAVAAAVEEQNAATQEIARNVEQAATGTQEVTSNILGVNQAVDKTGVVSTQVLSAAQDLAQQSTNLRSEVDSFLSEMRAA